MASTAAQRPFYTQEQLNQYFRYVGLPKDSHLDKIQVQALSPDEQLNHLAKILRYQLCAVPFENLDLHYSTVKGISLDIEHLFDKIVVRNAGRGGYCMQNNGFFATVLRSLGYSVMSVAGRVATALDEAGAPPPGQNAAFGGIGHQVNIITFGDGRKYYVDCGFGSQGPTHPIPMIEGYTAMNTGTKDNPATTMRLTRAHTANNTNGEENQKLWTYNVKYSGDPEDTSHPWIPCYCFSEQEFFPSDYGVMSHWVSTNRSSMFVQLILCMKFIMSVDGEYLIGDITMTGNVAKKREFAESTSLMEIKTDQDRVEAFEKFMGIKLSPAEISGIKGFPTELRTPKQ